MNRRLKSPHKITIGILKEKWKIKIRIAFEVKKKQTERKRQRNSKMQMQQEISRNYRCIEKSVGRRVKCCMSFAGKPMHFLYLPLCAIASIWIQMKARFFCLSLQFFSVRFHFFFFYFLSSMLLLIDFDC